MKLRSVLCCILALNWLWQGMLPAYGRTIHPVPSMAEQPVYAPAVLPTEPPTKDIILSFTGDCLLGSDLSLGYSRSFIHEYDSQNGDFGYFFENVLPIFQSDSLTIVNLENPFTNATSHMDKEFAFKAPPDYLNILPAASIEAVNLANNHTFDYYQKGYDDTVSGLQALGIAYFGNGASALLQAEGVSLGFLGYKGWAGGPAIRQQIADDINALRNKGAEIVIITFHWGIENQNYADAVQMELGRAAIDNGADLVIGHHPHVIQGIEEYKGKYIVYSLGNFCFGGNRNPSDKDSFIFQQCYTYQGDEQISSDIRIIPVRISSVTNRNDFRPTPVTGADAERIRNRLITYSSAYNQRDIIMDHFSAWNRPPYEKLEHHAAFISQNYYSGCD